MNFIWTIEFDVHRDDVDDDVDDELLGDLVAENKEDNVDDELLEFFEEADVDEEKQNEDQPEKGYFEPYMRIINNKIQRIDVDNYNQNLIIRLRH